MGLLAVKMILNKVSYRFTRLGKLFCGGKPVVGCIQHTANKALLSHYVLGLATLRSAYPKARRYV